MKRAEIKSNVFKKLKVIKIHFPLPRQRLEDWVKKINTFFR